MQDQDNIRRNYNHESDLFPEGDTEEIELAFHLQNMHLDDKELIERIVNRYTPILYKWIGVLLYYHQQTLPTPEDIFKSIYDVYVHAFRHINQFDGQSNVLNWLFLVGYEILEIKYSKNEWKNLFYIGRQQFDKVGPDINIDSGYWDSIDHLPRNTRFSLILRYLFNFELLSIAHILNLQVNEVHNCLSKGRTQLLVNPPEVHIEGQIQAYLDGLLDDNQKEINHMHQHIAQCALCHAYEAKLIELDKSLSDKMMRRWEFLAFDDSQLQNLVQSIYNALNSTTKRSNVHFSLRQIAWITGIALMFVGLAVVFIHLTPVEREFPLPESTAMPQLPPIVDMRPSGMPSQNNNEITVGPQFIEPDFSSDGNWAVFASIKIDPITQATLAPTIELYNRQSNIIQIISQSTATMNLPWIWWDLAPSISADGRWIAYVSADVDMNINGYSCKTLSDHNCLDVYLYNRENGSTQRVTHGLLGEAANGDSFSPSISADGNWVAFWSAASNLVPEVDDNCQQAETIINCLYIYIYSRESGQIERIPVRTIPGDSVFGVDRISLSADGRFIGFTATTLPQADGTLTGIESFQGIDLVLNTGPVTSTLSFDSGSSMEAVVYDHVSGEFEIENQTQDGLQGDGVSSSPVLSADGRYVAFISASTNLVEGDMNQHSDVFLRDRESGKITLVSVSSDGWQGNGDSGISFGDRGYYSLNISSDGRYVIFESNSTNLDPFIGTECSHLGMSVCKMLYVHDVQRHQTAWISALPNGDFSLFPDISLDGRWIMFMQSEYNCTSSQFLCSNVMLYDQHHRWLSNLTKYEEGVPSLPWSYTGSLVIPWELWESKAIAFSPDGGLLALGGIDSTVRIWSILDWPDTNRNNEPVMILDAGKSDPFTAIAFNNDGDWIAAGTTSGIVYIWELSERKLLYTLKEQTGLIKSLVFSQDDKTLVISTLYDAWIWHIETHKLVEMNRFNYGISAVYSIDISPVGDILASARGDGTVWLQKIPGGQVIGRLGGSQVASSDLAFSKDGTLLASRSLDGNIYLWRIGRANSSSITITPLNTFQTNGYIGALSFSPDNKYLASTGMVGEVLVWGVPDGKIFTTSSSVPNGRISGLTFSGNGDKLAIVIENEIVLWGISKTLSAKFFTQRGIDTLTDTPAFLEGAANDIPQLQVPVRNGLDEHLDLDQVITYFPLIVPTQLPERLVFQEARVNQDGSVLLRYNDAHASGEHNTLFIYEKIIGSAIPLTMTIGVDAVIIHTNIDTHSGNTAAEYVKGDWLWSQSFVNPPTDSLMAESHDAWRWDNASASQRLRWMQNGMLIGLYYQTENVYPPVLIGPEQSNRIIKLNTLLNQKDLEQIAAGMMPFFEANAINP